MFSTIKSRIIIAFSIILFISTVCSILIGAMLANYYLSSQLYGEMNVVYRVDSGQELDTIASNEYFNLDRLISKDNQDPELRTQARRVMVTSIIIVAIILIILFSFIFNFTYNRFIRDSINVDSEKINDFKQVKQMVSNQQQELVSSYADVEKINSFISHELKNSLAVLRTKDIDSDKFDDYIDQLNKQIDDIYALTASSLTNPVDVDLLLLLANLIDLNPHLNIDFSFEEGDFSTIGNPTLLTRAFDNIIRNAFKYGASKVDVKVSNLHGNIIVKISNNGARISKSELDKIFDFKYRTPELKSDGSGIGLALVRNIAQLHNAGIYVESDGQETSFYLSFRSC